MTAREDVNPVERQCAYSSLGPTTATELGSNTRTVDILHRKGTPNNRPPIFP